MALKTNDGGAPIAADVTKIVIFEEADDVGPFELTRQWADRLAWPIEQTTRYELAELACMSALARWLARWQPIHIHGAIPAGASPEAVCATLGGSLDEA